MRWFAHRCNHKKTGHQLEIKNVTIRWSVVIGFTGFQRRSMLNETRFHAHTRSINHCTLHTDRFHQCSHRNASAGRLCIHGAPRCHLSHVSHHMPHMQILRSWLYLLFYKIHMSEKIGMNPTVVNGQSKSQHGENHLNTKERYSLNVLFFRCNVTKIPPVRLRRASRASPYILQNGRSR